MEAWAVRITSPLSLITHPWASTILVIALSVMGLVGLVGIAASARFTPL